MKNTCKAGIADQKKKTHQGKCFNQDYGFHFRNGLLFSLNKTIVSL